jgi:formylglycine-generating enzyme required for sulfatase activity
MKTRTILASLAVFLAGYALCFAADAYTGTWKLNDAKSTFSPGATKNNTVVYAPAGDMVKVTVDGVDKDGKAVHNVWTGKFDGKDYPVTGEQAYDSRSYTKVDDHTMNMTLKKAGTVVGTGKIAVSADGKSRTVTTMGSDPKMTAMNNTAVYDKQ